MEEICDFFYVTQDRLNLLRIRQYGHGAGVAQVWLAKVARCSFGDTGFIGLQEGALLLVSARVSMTQKVEIE